jgi:hypothetical protein
MLNLKSTAAVSMVFAFFTGASLADDTMPVAYPVTDEAPATQTCKQANEIAALYRELDRPTASPERAGEVRRRRQRQDVTKQARPAGRPRSPPYGSQRKEKTMSDARTERLIREALGSKHNDVTFPERTIRNVAFTGFVVLVVIAVTPSRDGGQVVASSVIDARAASMVNDAPPAKLTIDSKAAEGNVVDMTY